MANGNLQMGLVITANVQQAKQQLNSLKNSLNEITSAKGLQSLGTTINSDMRKAVESATELKAIVERTTNTDTGKLDIQAFSTQLKMSGVTLADYKNNLDKLGPTGQNAFRQLTNAIISAENPVKQTNKLIKDFTDTLYRAAKWQLSQATLRAVVGGVQEAYTYAQDLNESLTNIRIVTGQSAEQMATFADNANKAAKALSATTLDYTDAALIYYQEGLDDSEVAERTDTTIKLANVTGSSAETVSEWMTAIWNNYDDGTKSLESYADMITALGASTASSSEEIATGLQQFAAIGETVGLSYEYATTALATVTAQTRQSASVVGNSFRTIFARLQSLSQGDTLEDGTDLTKYTKALQNIGVNVKDANGELKDMDTILDETAAKWSTLDKDQQMALANTVAGTRQYANFIAIFDNWDKFQENLSVAQNSSGALQEQAEIYAESWEAAKNHVQASLEAIYQDLIDDDFFIGLTNTLSDVLDLVDNIIDSMGGLRGVLLGLGTVLTSVLQKNIESGLSNLGSRFSMATGQTRLNANDLRQQALDLATADYNNLQASKWNTSEQLKTERLAQIELLNTQMELEKSTNNLTDAQKKHVESMLEAIQTYSQYAAEVGKTYDEQNAEWTKKTTKGSQAKQNVGIILDSFFNGAGENDVKEYKSINDLFTALKINTEGLSEDQKILEAYRAMRAKVDDKSIESIKIEKREAKAVQELFKERLQLNNLYYQDIEARDGITKAAKNAREEILREAQSYNKLTTTVSSAAKGFSSLLFAINGLDQIASIWDDKNLSGWQKFTGIVQNLTFTLPSAFSGIKSLKTAISGFGEAAAQGGSFIKSGIAASLVTNGDEAIEETRNQILMTRAIIEEQLKDIEAARVTVTEAQTKAEGEKAAAEELLKEEEIKLAAIEAGLIGEEATKNGLTGAQIAINTIQIASTEGVTLSEAELSLVESELSVKQLLLNTLLTDGALSAQLFGIAVHKAILKIKSAIPELLFAAAIIAGIIATVYALKKGIDNVIASTDAGKLKAANEELEKQKNLLEACKDVADEAAQNYEDLVSALDNLDSAKDKLEGLTKGTAEFNEIVSSTNESLLKTLERLGLIEKVKYHYDPKTGLIVVDNADDLENASQEQASASRSAEYNQQINVSNSQRKVDGLEAAQGVKLTHQVQDTMLGGLEDQKYFREVEYTTEEIIDIMDAYVAAANREGISLSGLTTESVKNNEVLQNIIKQGYDNEEFLSGLSQYYDDNAKNLKTSNINQQELGNNLLLSKGISLEAGDAIYADLIRQYASLFVTSTADEITQRAQNLSTDDLNDYASVIGGTVKDGKVYDSDDKIVDTEEIASYVLALEKQTDTTVGQIQNLITAIEKGESFDFGNGRAISQEQMAAARESTINSYKDSQRKFFSPGGQAEQTFNSNELEAEQDRVADYSTKAQEALENYEESLNEIYPELVNIEGMTERIAIANTEYNNGLEDLIDNIDDYVVALQNGDKGTETWVEAVDTLGRLLDIDGSQLSDAFLTSADNLALMQEAAYGNIDAIEQLREEATRDIIQNVIEDTSQANEALDALNNYINSDAFDDLTINSTLDDTEFTSVLNQMLQNGQLTVDELSNIMNSFGFEPSIEWEEVSAAEAKSAHMKSYVQVGDTYQPIEDGVDLSTYETVWIPKINSSKTIYRGKPSQITSGANRAKAANNGSGSGSGSGSNKETKDTKKFQDEVDRYHEIKEAIEDNTTALERYEKEKDRAFGREKLRQLQKQIEAQKEQIALQEQYNKEIYDYWKYDAAQVKGYGVTLDDTTGRITNYDEALQAQLAKYNAAVATYNASAQSEQDKNNFEAAEEYYNNFKDAIEQYEETLNLYEEQQEALIDLQEELYDLALETAKTKLEWRVGLNQDDIDLIEWQIQNIGDEAEKTADKIAKLSQETASYLDNIEAVTEEVSEIFNNHGYDNGIEALLNGELDFDTLQFTDAEVEELRAAASSLRDYYDTLVDLRQEVHDSVLKVYSDFNDELDENKNHVDSLVKNISTLHDIVGLLGQELTGFTTGDLVNMTQQALDNQREGLVIAQEQLESDRRAVDELKQQIEDLYAIGDEEGAKLAEENLKQMQSTLDEVQTDIYDRIKALAEYAREVFDEAIEASAEKYNDLLGGDTDLGWLSSEFSRQQELDDLYLDEYEKLHGLNDLQTKINKSLANDPSGKVYTKLNDLLDDTNAAMAEGVQISEADLTTLENRLAVVQALDALENAQNAKSAVRMTRDNNGNFSYTYTADQDAIDDALSDYNDAFYTALDYQHTRQDELQSEMIQTRQDFIDKLQEIDDTYELNSEEWYAAREQLMADYQLYEDYYVQQFGENFAEMARLRDEDWADYEEKYNQKIAVESDFVDNFNETVLSQLTGWETLEEAHDAWTEATNTYWEESAAAAEQWELNNEATLEAAGTSLDDFKNFTNEALTDIQEDIEATAEESANMADEFDNNFDSAISATWEFESNFGVAMSSINTMIESVISELNIMIRKLGETSNEATSMAASAVTAANTAVQAAIAAANAASSAAQNANLADYYRKSAEDDDSNKNGTAHGWYVVVNGVKKAGPFTTAGKASSELGFYTTPNTKNAKVSYFDTGGYTGDWNSSEGRIAMLHEKELVLNKSDTANILSVVDIVREISSNLGSQFGRLNANLSNGTNLSFAGGSDELQQTVYINAQFEGQTEAYQIETALSNLINSASQYTNRK